MRAGDKMIEQKVYNTLDKMNIEYELITHAAVFTVEEADECIKDQKGVRTKTLFLCNKKSEKFALLIVDGKNRLNIKELAIKLNMKGLKFASADNLKKKLNLTPGSVSLFGLLNNQEKDVLVYIDKSIELEKSISFHPNINTKTIFIRISDMYRFLEELGYEYEKIEI